MPLRRHGRPGLLATIGRTAVIAGTATMTTQAVSRYSQQRVAEQQALADQKAAVAYPSRPARVSGAEPDLVVRLSELAELHSSGVLTESEFKAAKKQLLA
jgi:hypothetical protein